MDYVNPSKVVDAMIEAGAAKGRLSVKDLLIRGFLSGALLAYGTSLALEAIVQTGMGIIGALVFPSVFVIVIILGLELVTGSFALLPLGFREGLISYSHVSRNWGWVFLGNLIGGLFYGGLLWIALTQMGSVPPEGVALELIDVAEAKTIGYAQHGAAGLVTVFTKAILCNWMVCLGVVMGMTSTSTISKIFAAWLPIFIFFAQGFEHAVVNMFVIPAGMMMGADVSIGQWWLWNQLPVTLGNIVGGLFFTGLALYWTHHQKAQSEEPTVEVQVPVENEEPLPR